MADSFNSKTAQNGDDEDEDYLGNLFQFIPSETSQPPKAQFREISKQQSSSFPVIQIAKAEAPIPQSNMGLKMLKQMGYTPGSALGKEGSGRAKPVGIEIRRTRAGIGQEDPIKEKMRRVEARTEKKRKTEAVLMAQFGCRQRSQWRNRRVVVNFQKAKGVLDQLENKEIAEPKKEDEDNEEGEAEEEDLHHILMRLREEQYCPFCGCRYEPVEVYSPTVLD